jgi:hypothetical protein
VSLKLFAALYQRRRTLYDVACSLGNQVEKPSKRSRLSLESSNASGPISPVVCTYTETVTKTCDCVFFLEWNMDMATFLELLVLLCPSRHIQPGQMTGRDPFANLLGRDQSVEPTRSSAEQDDAFFAAM